MDIINGMDEYRRLVLFWFVFAEVSGEGLVHLALGFERSLL